MEDQGPGRHWINLNTEGLCLTQAYPGISQHPTSPDFMLIGSRDNAISLYRKPSWRWPKACNSAGGFTAIDPVDATRKTWYFAEQNLLLSKTVDDGATASQVMQGLDRVGVAFIAPVVMDPNDGRVLIAGGGRTVGTTNEHNVYRTINGAGQWNPNSVDLGGVIRALAFAPSDSTVYYAGTSNGRVWRTTNTGAAWTNLTKAPLPNRVITDLAVDASDPDIAYVTFSGFGTGHVFRTANDGGAWTNISSNLPDIPVNAILVDPTYPNTLQVGTDIGIFRTLNAGGTWQTFDKGLPTVVVHDLILSPDHRQAPCRHVRARRLRAGNGK